MSAHEVCRPDGGPLERTHMKDMVQRNTLESVAFTKIAKHLETERKAFVRQSTRDEDEMKHLLQRLQIKQQTTPYTDESDSDEVTLEEHDDDDDDDDEDHTVINPYPITIVPKFGTTGSTTKGSNGKPTRRRSDEYDDFHESMSMMTSSSVSFSEPMVNFDEVTAEWLASPNAISSVRRLRKTVPEQIQRKIMIRTGSEVNWNNEAASPLSHSRSNSLKERKKSAGVIDDNGSPRGPGRVSRRGGSLKERKLGHVTDDLDQKKLLRSYSMITKPSLRDVNLKSDIRCFRRHSDRKQSNEETGSDALQGVIADDNGHGEQTKPTIRKNSKKSEKVSLSRKASK